MSEWAAKRFWKAATVEGTAGDFGVLLDSRALRSPAKSALRVPSRAMAEAIAAEWDAQDGVIRPDTMPVTRSANAAIDKVRVQFDEVVAMLGDYGDTDLLCYRAESPEELARREADAWDPLLDWARAEFGAHLQVTSGVMPVAQDPQAVAPLRAALAALSEFELAAMHDLIAISGSLVLGLAVGQGRLDAAEAWRLSRIDDDWQIAQWGDDEEAAELAALKRAALLDAERIWYLARA
ncbi:ATPase [Thioclava dalianensis]|uniref:ATPase n=1 Tax=Thioclava dalianensis TaxID=1185766 RepID=A0A074U7X6_9RHOB|nr:ATP12 family protein [Thioclava dalianensis]KEP70757.1 ATPase [Thioclava dalianensis]SFN10005.1 Chaperone required for the assembly of the F1-ATPase [Thioclava dalianensis]